MNLKNKAKSGLIWTFSQQFGNQFISFFISIILARILMPREFGLIGMIAVFTSVGEALIKGGMTQSLIRNKKNDELDYSTVFHINLITSLLIYGLVYLAAPNIAGFYAEPILKEIIRLYCLSFIISGLTLVQVARLTKSMKFKTLTLISLPATVLGGLTAVVMAYSGFGVWSIVWNQLIFSTIFSIQLWIFSGWTPKLVFDFQRFKYHFNFGYKITLNSLLGKIFENIYLIIIGKYFSASQLGYYTRAETLRKLPVNNITMALGKVTYPLFAEIQDDDVRLKNIYQRLMKTLVFIMAPLMLFLGVLAQPIFVFLFTEKWLPAVPYFQILCVGGILQPILAYNLNILKVKGRSDLVLKLSIYQKVLIIIGVLLGVNFGIYGLLFAQVVISILSFFIYSYYTNRFINYSTIEQIKDFAPFIITSGICAGLVYFVDSKIYMYNDIIRILAGGLAGSLIYLLISKILNFTVMEDLINLLGKKQN